MASIPGFRFDITGASGSQGLLTPKSSWKAYVFPRGGYAKQDSTGTLITFDSADVASRFAANDWIQAGLSIANIRKVSAVGGNSLSVAGAALTVSENDRIFLIGTTQPTTAGSSATYRTPATVIRERDDDGSDIISNSMITSNANGLIQGFCEATFYDVLIQDGDQSNQGSLVDLPVGAVEFGSTASIGGDVSIAGTLIVGTSATITASTSQSQGQGALTADVNEVSVCANRNDTVTLPAATAGRRCVVMNNGAKWLQIFPASGDAILPNSANGSVVLPNNEKLEFVSYDGTSWKPSIRPKSDGMFNVLDYGAKGDGTTDDKASIQAAIDAAAAVQSGTSTTAKVGSTVFFPVAHYIVNGSIVLPKATQSTHPRIVGLLGESKASTVIQGGTGFSSGDAVIEWESTTYAVWDQRIENMTIIAPAIDGTYCILYEPSLSSSWAEINAEPFTAVIENVELEGANQYNPALFYIKSGIARNCRFINIGADTTLTSRAYDTMAFLSDSTLLSGGGIYSDDTGFNWCRWEHIWTTPQRGGYCGFVKGRVNNCIMENCEGGFGNYSDPVIDLTSSFNSRFIDVTMEGKGEDPQILLTSSRYIRFENLGVGHMNQPAGKGSPWGGDGINLVASTDCFIERAGDDSGFTSWSGADDNSHKFITLDSNSHRNIVRYAMKHDTPYAPTDEFTDSGNDNIFQIVDHTNDREWYSGGPTYSELKIKGNTQEHAWLRQKTEEVAIDNTGTPTFDTTTTMLPADSLILAVVCRCSATVGGSRTYTVGDDSPATTRFDSTGINATDGITLRGLEHWTGGDMIQDTGVNEEVRLTLSGNPTDTTGKIRVTVFYVAFKSPVSDT